MFRVIREQHTSRDVDAQLLTFDGDDVVFWTEGVEVDRVPQREVLAVEAQPLDSATLVEAIRAEHPNAYRSWTPEDDELLAELFDGGASLEELATRFGRRVGAIRSRLSHLEEGEVATGHSREYR